MSGDGPHPFIGRGASFEGQLFFRGLLRIDGELRGTARSEGTLVIGADGVVRADVEVGTLIVNGTVLGSVRARRVEIASTGRLEGELTTPALRVEEGACLEARVRMSPSGLSHGSAVLPSPSGVSRGSAVLPARRAVRAPLGASTV